MTKERFIELIETTKATWEGDNIYQGLQILAKYTTNVVQGADHDIIFSESIDTLIENGITEEDVTKLRELNWMVEMDEYVACFV